MNPDHLIELAAQIVQLGGSTPRQAMLNRAVSTAYYAVFHAVCLLFVRETVGSPSVADHWAVVTPVFRSIDHAGARKSFAQLAGASGSSPLLKQVSRAFVELQRARTAADYSPDSESRCTRREALELIAQGESAIRDLRRLSKDERRVLVSHLISKQR